jgi:protein-L-isoaspartate O-methyltransferase
LPQGYPARAYDVIFLDGGSEIERCSLFGQLANRGRLVAVVGVVPVGRAMVYRSTGGKVSGWPAFDAAAALLLQVCITRRILLASHFVNICAACCAGTSLTIF